MDKLILISIILLDICITHIYREIKILKKQHDELYQNVQDTINKIVEFINENIEYE